MASFIGDYTSKVDAKGRAVFPSSLKKQVDTSMPDKFVVKKDIYEKCLILYTLDEWEKQNKILRAKLNPYNKEHNKFKREYFKGSAEVSLDANSRILIPARLLEYAQVKKEVYFSGQDQKIEIWAKEIYEQAEQVEDDFSMLAEKILGGDLNIDFDN